MIKDEILGKEVSDKITGFNGIATSKHIYLTGCTQYGVQPKVDKDNNIPDKRYFDDGRLAIIGEGVQQEDVSGDYNGYDFREHPEE